MLQIKSNSQVSIHFKIRLKDGTIAEDSQVYNHAFTFCMGDQSLPQKLETQILGLQKGDQKKIMLMPEDAFGESHPALIFNMPREKFDADIELEEGLIMGFSNPAGQDQPGVIREINGEDIKVDFNHPLSGQVIMFEVEVLDVVSAPSLKESSESEFITAPEAV